METIKVEEEEDAAPAPSVGSASSKLFGCAPTNQFTPSDEDYWVPALGNKDKDKRYFAVGKLAELIEDGPTLLARVGAQLMDADTGVRLSLIHI